MSQSHAPIRLVVFDVDGTLVDSQATIVACAQAAFAAEGLDPPEPVAIRRIVGLSLPQAMARLLGYEDLALSLRIAEHYKAAFFEHRSRPDFTEPLFPGAREVLDRLMELDILMGVATGKALRGLKSVLERHALEPYFVSLQTADFHPSKPHPSMVLTAMNETGMAASETMLVGDTTFDIEMAVSAGALPIGVRWGNHPPDELIAAGAHRVLDRFADLLPLVPNGSIDTRASA
jgi:phosphoglycolate phosphatase